MPGVKRALKQLVGLPGPSAVAVPAQQLTDGVVRLRTWRMSDAPAVHAAVQDPEISRFTGIPPNHTLKGVEEWLSRRPDGWSSGAEPTFAVVDAESGRLLGSIGVERSIRDSEVGEVGYWIAPEARGRGVATAAVRLVSAWAFSAMGVKRLELLTHLDNEASQRVAINAGFRREGVMRSCRQQHGRRVDLVMFARLEGD